MNQEKIGKFIKDIRKKEGLTQEKFAEKYGVTYQAVSKWENGKNIPDLSILKEMCKEYKINLEDLLDANEGVKNNKNKLFFISIILIIIIIVICLILLFNRKDNDFHLKPLSTTCDSFDLYGSIAYNDNKTSIHISNISYCGEEDENKYKEIECNFYEIDGNTKIKIDSYKYDDKEITLKEFLKKVKFNVEHYSNSCKMYKENSLLLEIKATDKNNQTIFYDLPLELEDNCK